MKRITTLLAVMSVFFVLKSLVQAYTFLTLDVPSATDTRTYGINNSGVVVGSHNNGTNTGFMYDGNTYTMLNKQGNDINDSGIILGPDFLYDGNTYSTLVVPGEAKGINNSGVESG